MAKKPSAQERLAQLHASHAVVQVGGKVRIVSWEPSELHPGVRVPVFSSVDEMKVLYANQSIAVKIRDADGNETIRNKALFPYWLEHPDRPTARGITMDTSGEQFVDGRLNLWRGFGVEPKPGEWPLLRRHILDVLCSGNKDHARYMARWIAWRVQNPIKQSEVALVLGGDKGTGKGKFLRLLCRLFGTHAIQISDRKHLTGSFNAHFMQTCLLFADEAFWPGDKGGEGTLKRLITEPTLFIEPKGLNGFEVPNRLAVVIAGNEDWLVPASGDERRFAVFKVSNAHKQDFEYFAALDNEIDNGGAEAFLHAMLTMDLDGWHPRQNIPETDALAGQKAISARPEEQWLGSILEEGALPSALYEDGSHSRIVHPSDPSRARSQLLWKHATRSHPKLRHWSELEYRAFLDQNGVKTSERRTAQGRYRQFLPLPEMRRAWLARRPWWPAFDDMEADWRFGYTGEQTSAAWAAVPKARLPDSVDVAGSAETRRAVEFLRTALRDGPVRVTELEVDYEFAQHSEGAICSAMEKLGTSAVRRNGAWVWILQEERQAAGSTANSAIADVDLSGT